MDFIQLFNSWYNKDNDKAEDFNFDFNFRKEGNATVNAVCDENRGFTAGNWSALQKSSKRESFTI
jgi:leucyl-tRNA synthetase